MNRHVVSVLVALGLAILATTQLPGLHLETRILEILPDLPAARDYRAFVERFGGIDNIFVAIDGGSAGDLETAADVAHEFADRLAESTLVRATRCGLTDADEAFWFESVLPRALLLPGVGDSPRLAERLGPDALAGRVAAMRSRLAGPLGAFEAQVFAADPLGVAADLHPAFAGSTRSAYDPGLDAFVSRSRSRVLVVVTSAIEEMDSAAGEQLVAAIDSTFSAVRDELGVDVTYDAIGGPIYAVHDASLIRADVIRTTVGSSLLVFVVLLAYFGNIRVPLALTLSLAVAVVWIAGGVAFFRGYLSVFGISFGAILIGLGVDYGIHAASSFRDALAGGVPSPVAMGRAIRETGPAIVTSAGTTAAAFLVLASSSVAPVREMGGLIAAGVIAVLVASFLLGAPLAVLFFRGAAVPASFVRKGVGRLTDRLVAFAVAHRGWVLASSAGLTLVAAFGIGSIGFNADLGTMRPQGGGLEAVERMFVDEFALDLDTLQVVVSGPDLGAALVRADEVAHELGRSLADANVESSAELVPSGALAAARTARLAGRIDSELALRLRRELESNGFDLAAFDRAFAVLDAVAAGRPPDDVPVDGWPDWIARDVRVESDRAFVALRLVPARPDGASATVEPQPEDWPPAAWLDAIDRVAPDASVVSVPLLGRELRGAIGKEFRRLLLWSFAIIAMVVLVSFKGRPLPSVLALLPVAVGALWLLGLCGFLGLRITPFSVMVAPVLLGIGIDDGLHALHGVRHAGGLVESVRLVGRAMVATTVTTAAGFGSLMLSRAPALQQAGFLVATGTLFCLVVSLMLLPALGPWLSAAARKPTPEL